MMQTDPSPQSTISVARDFSRTPGPRRREDGPHSGQKFLDEVLRPAFQAAIAARTVLHVDLDGCAGFPTSFLEEAFGGLAREFGADIVLKGLSFTSFDEPLIVEEIHTYIREARP